MQMGTLRNANADKGALNQDGVYLDYQQLRKAVLTLRSVNHELRQSIIELLHQKERMTVTDIYIRLRLEQSVASQHLAILRKSGVVDTHRDGKYIYYFLNYDRLKEIGELIEQLAE